MTRIKKILITISILTITILSGSILFLITPTKTKANNKINIIKEEEKPLNSYNHYVVVYLDRMKLELKENDKTIKEFEIISKGKPGSYYETIGGVYINDYKKPIHFSSIGHVYMPYSIHVFGNYFIHGIPYYENGLRVSSTYSGGCIRLKDEDAKEVYEFINKNTPIVITKNNADEFENTNSKNVELESEEMVRLMVASISLEYLTQDDEIIGIDGLTTTRKKMLVDLIKNGDERVSYFYAKTLGVENFINAMNQKSKAIGLTNTNFENINGKVKTTYEDYERFMKYIDSYKSFLRTI